jgi:poly(beta-D-mannuronate) lyase
MNKTIFKMALMLFITVSTFAQTVTVTTGPSLQTQVNAAAPGAVFIVPNGTYNNFVATLTKVATAENPVIIRAATVGGVTLTGDSRFVFKKSAHIILEGFVFNCTGNNTLVKLEASNNIRMTRNVFELTTSNPIKWIVVGGIYNDYNFEFLSHHNRIDHNIFKNKFTPGNFITIDGTYNQTQTVNQQSQYDRIDHNYFFNNSPRVENEKESIRIGNSQLCQSSGYTVVEFNLFEQCDGDPEIVSVKSNDNFIRYNVFNKNYGTLTLRQGNRTRVEGNYFFGGGRANGLFGTTPIYTGGMRIYGTDHIVINNYFEGLYGTMWDAPMTLTQGDVITGQSTNNSAHYRPERITIAYNTFVNNKFGIEIGYSKSDNSYNKKLKDIYIANNVVMGSENSLVKFFNDQAGEVEFFNNILYPTGTAQVVTGNPPFTAGQAIVQNPELTQNGNIWRASATSPLIAAGIASLAVPSDIEGQSRPALSNAGADHFSTENVTYFPVTINDVGPNAYETVMAVTPVATASIVNLYPNPTKGIFEINMPSVSQQEVNISVYDMHGRKVSEKVYDVTDGKVQLDLVDQPTGVYFVKLTTNGTAKAYRVVKQ